MKVSITMTHIRDALQHYDKKSLFHSFYVLVMKYESSIFQLSKNIAIFILVRRMKIASKILQVSHIYESLK